MHLVNVLVIKYYTWFIALYTNKEKFLCWYCGLYESDVILDDISHAKGDEICKIFNGIVFNCELMWDRIC